MAQVLLFLIKSGNSQSEKSSRPQNVSLGPEMAAPILWAPGKIAFFLQENLRAHKIPRFRGGGIFWIFLGGGGG